MNDVNDKNDIADRDEDGDDEFRHADAETAAHDRAETGQADADQAAEDHASGEGSEIEVAEQVEEADEADETDETDEADEGEEGEETGDAAVDARQLRLLEAILFASDRPLSERELAHRLPAGAALKPLLRALQADYAERGVNVVRAGQTWAFRTAPDLASLFTRETEVERKLSRAAIESLAIIAYHQPVTRSEVEEIRGVGLSKGTLDVLFEAGWIRPKGRRQTPGRPVIWGTTDAFLHQFGLESLADLPGVDELKATGLLDTRPALEAYPLTAAGDVEDGDDDADGEAADDALDAGPDAGPDDPEPLDPET